MAAYTDSLIPRRTTSEYWFSNLRPGVAALLLGGAFGAGVYLGNAEPSGHSALEMAGSEAWIAQVDARSEKLDGVRAELELRYHDELVGPPRDSRDRRRAHHVPKPAPAVLASLQKDENHQTAKSLRDRLQAVADSMRDSEGSDPPPAAKDENVGVPPELVTQAEVKALADQVSLPEHADDEERVQLDDAADDIESIEEPREKSVKDSRRIEDALARVLGNPAAGAESGSTAPQPAENTRRYYVQVAATPSLEGAQKLVDTLGHAGFSAVVLQGEGKTQTPVYRVRVGPLANRELASAQVGSIQSKAGLAGFVIRD